MRTSRRKVLKAGIAAAAVSAVSASLPHLAAAEDRRPNIVWIVCHDIYARWIGCYGNTLAKTPTIDGLARDGVLYNNAFTICPVCAPSRFTLVTGLYPQTCAPAQQMRAFGVLPPSFKPLPILMREAGYYCTNNFFTDYNMAGDQKALWDACDPKAHWRNRPAGKPFFSVYDYGITHESQVFGDQPTTTDPARVDIPPFLPDNPRMRQLLARCTDVQNKQDLATAHLLGELHEDGLDDNTFVFFMADHGGVHPRSKRYCFEDGLHVPLIVRAPLAYQELVGTPSGKPSDELISHVDMAPTVLSLARVEIPSAMRGRPFMGKTHAPEHDFVFSMRDRMGERYDFSYSVRDKHYRYTRNYMPQRIYAQHGAYEWQSEGYQAWQSAHLAGELKGPQTAFWKTKPSEELYEVAADPHSIVNLADAPEQQARLIRMRKALDGFIVSFHDNGFIPEGANAQGYVASRVPGAYPLQEVLEIANLTIERNPRNIPAFVRGLDHPNDIVRFWNVHGLVLVAPLSGATLAEARKRLKTEKVDYVRCGYAEALIASGEYDSARDALMEIALNESSSKVAIRALNIISLLPNDQLVPIRGQIAQINQIKNQYLKDLSNMLVARVDNKYTPSFNAFSGFPGMRQPFKPGQMPTRPEFMPEPDV